MIPLLVVIALVAGLLIWSPWVAPAVPGQVRATAPSPTSVLLQWDRSEGHTGAGKYSILRDGAAIATVGGDQTTYRDEGLRPGQSYRYSVVAQSWLRDSEPAENASVRTLAPSPAKPGTGKVTTSAATLTWSPPADTPAPDAYDVIRDGNQVVSVPAGTTTYQDLGLSPATSYRYQVVAKWGGNKSDPSDVTELKTVTPPLAAARLTGSAWSVKFAITKIDGITNLRQGVRWSDTWDLSDQCTSGACHASLSGNFTPPGFRPTDFTVRLIRRGTLYTGSTTVHRTSCQGVQGTDTLTVRITVRSAGPEGTQWVARSFAGTVTVVAPLQNVGGGFFCPGSRIDSNVGGQGMS
jgi:hypothetical protein